MCGAINELLKVNDSSLRMAAFCGGETDSWANYDVVFRGVEERRCFFRCDPDSFCSVQSKLRLTSCGPRAGTSFFGRCVLEWQCVRRSDNFTRQSVLKETRMCATGFHCSFCFLVSTVN